MLQLQFALNTASAESVPFPFGWRASKSGIRGVITNPRLRPRRYAEPQPWWRELEMLPEVVEARQEWIERSGLRLIS